MITFSNAARLMGTDVTATSVRGVIQNCIYNLGKQQIAFADSGRDPKDVNLDSMYKKGSTSQSRTFPSSLHCTFVTWLLDIILIVSSEMARVLGSDITAKALTHQFAGRLKPLAKLMLSMADAGVETKDIDVDTFKVGKAAPGQTNRSSFLSLHIGFEQKLSEPISIPHQEIASVIGSKSTSRGIALRFVDRIKPIAQAQLDMRPAGQDPKDLDLTNMYSKSSNKKAGRGQTLHFFPFVIALRSRTSFSEHILISNRDQQDVWPRQHVRRHRLPVPHHQERCQASKSLLPCWW